MTGTNRVLDEPDTCTECDEPAVRGGLCPKHWREYNHDVIADGGRTHEDFDELTDADGIDQPPWAAGLDVGDAVRYDSPVGTLEGQIIGFSTKRGLEGQPAVELPTTLEDHFPDGTQLVVLREEDLVAGKDLAPDGGEPTHHHLVIHPGDQFDDPEDWKDRLFADGAWEGFFDSDPPDVDGDDLDAQALVDQLEDDGFATDGGYVEWVELTAPRRDVLFAIAAGDDPSSDDVRDRLGAWRGTEIGQPGFSRLVNELEADGLVESRREGPRKHYRLTDRAESLLADRLQEHADLLGAEVELSGGPAEMTTDGGRDRDLPEPCPSCDTPCHVIYQTTDGEALSCPNPDCPRNSPDNLATDGGTTATVNVNGELLTRQICPCCWEPGVVPVWEPVRGFLRCVECGAHQETDDWPDDYRYPEWRRRARTPRTQLQFVADGGFDSLLDVDVDEEAGCAVLRISAERHGWSVETLVENSREYLKDGVESTTTQANCFVHEPDVLRELAQELWSAADEIESTVATDGGSNPEQFSVGTRVRSNREFSGVPEGTEGVIDEDLGATVMVAWDLDDRPLPVNYEGLVENGGPCIFGTDENGRRVKLLRDGFDKETELQFLDLVEEDLATDGGQDLVDLLRELGLTERQIGIFQNEPDSLHDVFEQLDLHGELRLEDLELEVDYSGTTVLNALDTLVKGYGIVGSRTDPDDGRKKIYYLGEPEEKELRPDGGEDVDVFLDDEETIDPVGTFKKKATCPHPPDAIEAVEVEEIGETIWVCSECGHKLDGWEREERELSPDGGWNRRREVQVVEDGARFRVKASAVDQHGDHVENDELSVDAPKGGEVVLASIECGFLDALVVSNVGPDPESSIDGDELDDEGTNCAQCSGTIVTEQCVITEDDFSQIRTRTDCGAHGIRYGIFGVNIERTSGPVYDESLGPSFLDWCRDQGLIDRE